MKISGRDVRLTLFILFIIILIFLEALKIKHLSVRHQEYPIPTFEPIPEEQKQELEQETEEIIEHTRATEIDCNVFTLEEAELLRKVAQAEAGNQSVEGMRLVMSVVLNRVKSEDFPNSIEEVIYQPHQFSTVSNGAIDKAIPSPECNLAFEEIRQGLIAEGIIAFETTSSNELDKYFTKEYCYKKHQFYVKKDGD